PQLSPRALNGVGTSSGGCTPSESTAPRSARVIATAPAPQYRRSRTASPAVWARSAVAGSQWPLPLWPLPLWPLPLVALPLVALPLVALARLPAVLTLSAAGAAWAGTGA